MILLDLGVVIRRAMDQNGLIVFAHGRCQELGNYDVFETVF